MSNEAPAITIVSNLLIKAIKLEASDIHLEPNKNFLRVRFRVDGLLYDEEPIEQNIALQVISRIKVVAHMNLAERRIPQDGTFSYTTDLKEVDLRVATFPSIYGEKLVIRILDRAKNILTIDNLGFDCYMLEQVKNIAQFSNGFFLVTGPTGSGKTTTLHGMLSFLNSPQKNVVSLEDPIEYHVPNITQGQIYPEIGFTFHKGIRAIVRQDPDIIMVGEIRDCETAQVAIQAALTGHFVLSTLHTNNACGALMRLLDMKIEPFLINAALTGILAQRLVRKLCYKCRYQTDPTSQERAMLDRLNIACDSIYKSSGCENCHNTGYKGRIGIFELLVISQKLRSIITQNPSFDAICAQAHADGLKPLVSDGIQKVTEGITSLYELCRVIL